MFDTGGKHNSRLEGLVLDEFVAWGFQPEWNYPVDKFEIDFAFPELKLAIEIDGAKFHREDQKERDSWRQKILESKGWKFERFDGWFAFKFTEVLVAKILLKYFPEELSEEIRKRAILKLGLYFKKLDIDVDLGDSLLRETI